MKITTTETYTLLNIGNESFDVFFQNFKKKYTDFNKKHLIVNISTKNNISKKNISLFLEYANKHQNNGISFVIICKNINIDDFPVTFNITPTLIEAKDIIELENIERDLGF